MSSTVFGSLMQRLALAVVNGDESAFYPLLDAANEWLQCQDVKDRGIDSIIREMPVRARNAFRKLRVKNYSDLEAISDRDLMECRNFGRTTLVAAHKVLARYGLRLGGNDRE